MKLELIFSMIILSFFSLINSDESPNNQKRYLQESQADVPLTLLGFEKYIVEYHYDVYQYYTFKISPVFKTNNKTLDLNIFVVDIQINYTISHLDGSFPEKPFNLKNITCKPFKEEPSGFIEGLCKEDLFLEKNGSITSLEIISIYNKSKDIQIEISYPAKKLMKNPKNAEAWDMEGFRMNLMDIIIKDNKVINLQGNITGITLKFEDKSANISLNNTEYNCSITQYSNKSYTHEISFYPESSINESLVYQVMDVNGRGRVIFFEIEDEKNKRIVYINDWDKGKGNHTSSKNHFIDLLGIQNYKEKEDGKATGKAYFKGDLDSLYTLKKFMKVNVLVKPTQKRLRYLDEEKTTNITGIGTRNDTITNGEITYDIEYNKTKDQEIIMFFNDFEFSDNETFPPSETIKANQMNISTDLADPYSITKSDPLVIKFMNITNIDKNQSGSNLTFEFDPGNELGTITKTNGTVNYIPIINNSNSEREEMNCTYERNNTIHKLICEPGKNIKTNTNTWRINIWKAQNNNSLRNLQEVGNTTFFLDKSGSNDNLIEYTLPEKSDPPVRKKKKGLSAGAIVAIVLATVAVVAAVIVALLLLKTGPKPPIEADKISIPNSSTNINH